MFGDLSTNQWWGSRYCYHGGDPQDTQEDPLEILIGGTVVDQLVGSSAIMLYHEFLISLILLTYRVSRGFTVVKTLPLRAALRRSALDDEQRGDLHLPSSGISVSDEIDESQRDAFITEILPISGLHSIAKLVTTPVLRGSFEPIRYLVSISSDQTLSHPTIKSLDTNVVENKLSAGVYYVMIDVPPFSPQLVTKMKEFMGYGSTLIATLITNRDSIHRDEAPSVYATRKSDLILWKQAFPDMKVVGYRLDIPRDCRPYVSQVLDGYGPFALDSKLSLQDLVSNFTFVETGRPLTYVQWDQETAYEIMNGRRLPDDTEYETAKIDEGENYSTEAIRAREEGSKLLAVYTPGHTFGSISYIFPEHGFCFSGFTIPVEESRFEENFGENTGPVLDCRGFITTSRAGLRRQMTSAKVLVTDYIDRIRLILPARGDHLTLDEDLTSRKEALLSILDQYQKIGDVYERLGILDERNE